MDTAIDTARAAALFHALADETRLQVLGMLFQGERCVCEMTAALDMAQSKLSWHLKTLSDAGIITGRRVGRWNYYSLNPETLSETQSLLEGIETMARRAPTGSGCCL
jgi:ArsR family transcriptional regulator, arsenate/arsenite/antimonite-responsive transcriptional repressor